MQRGFAEDAAAGWVCSGFEETQPDFFGAETGRSDKRSIALGLRLEIEIGAGLDQGVDQWECTGLGQFFLEQEIGDVVQRMRPDGIVRSPRSEERRVGKECR